jgi:fimbrial chaperone protein
MFLRAVLCTILALAIPGTAMASAWKFTPVNVNLPSDQRVTTVTLMNTDTVPLSFQIRVFKWGQGDGKDSSEPADDMMVSPPAVVVPAGKSYQVRILRRTTGPVGGEKAYRLLIDQLAPPSQDSAALALGVSIMYRASLPLYVTDRKAAAQVHWRVRQDAAGLHIIAQNAGNRRARIERLVLTPEGGAPISFGDGVLGAILSGATATFTFQPEKGKSVPQLAKGSPVVITAIDSGVPEGSSRDSGGAALRATAAVE